MTEPLRTEFGGLVGRTWLNCAHQGPLPRRAEAVVLANSASYGLEFLARTLPLEPDDEVLLVEGDFPATIYPWLPLRERGIRVRPAYWLTHQHALAGLARAQRDV